MPGITHKTGTKTIAVLCGLLLVGICTAPRVRAKCGEQAGEQHAEPVKNRYEDSRILVEAFLAEVKLEALYEAGVNPIGQEPNSVSIERIQQCLKNRDSGKVTTGAKVATKQGRGATTKVSETIYVERERPARKSPGGEAQIKKVFDSYDTNKQFDIEVSVGPAGRITTGFGFRQYTLGTIPDDQARPPGRISRNWSGHVTLEAGKPTIVGAEQDEQKAVFLILCAHIEDN